MNYKIDEIRLVWVLNKILPFSVEISATTPMKVHLIIRNIKYKLYLKGDNTMLQAKHLKRILETKYPELFL